MLKQALIAGAALVLLSGCQTAPKFVTAKPELARIPQVLKEACPQVQNLPNRDLTASEIARLWGADRSSLGECLRRHSALADAIAQLERQGK